MIRQGATRTVVLIGPYVLKIARIPIVYSLAIIGKRIFRRKYSKYRYSTLRETARSVCASCFLKGIQSNRREYERWKKRRTIVNLPESAELIPTRASLLGGIINIQDRAYDVGGDCDTPSGQYDDRACNKGWYRGKKVWIDYGYARHPIDEL